MYILKMYNVMEYYHIGSVLSFQSQVNHYEVKLIFKFLQDKTNNAKFTQCESYIHSINPFYIHPEYLYKETYESLLLYRLTYEYLMYMQLINILLHLKSVIRPSR